MKILLVGGSSVIGQSVASRLSLTHQVTIAGRAGEVRIDLSRPEETLVPCGHYDVVVHLAAHFGGGRDDELIRAELVNSVGTLMVCRLAHSAGAGHLVLVSSIFASYGPRDPFFGIYSLSKRHGEEVARLYCEERGMALTILRPTQVYGDGFECRKHQEFFYHMMERAAAGMAIEIFGSNDAKRNYLHLDDLTEMCTRIIERQCVGEYVCAHPLSPRLSEIAHAAFAEFGMGGCLSFLSDRPSLKDLPEITDHQIYERTGYVPRIDIKEGIRRIKLNWVSKA